MKRRLSLEEGEGIGVRAEINVTSLVDVAFTLLIIFMITAPILQGGIEIEVPEAPAGPITSTDALVVSIDDDGQIYIADDVVTLEEFEATIGAILQRQESTDVSLKADTNLEYGLVLRVVGTLYAEGASAVNLVANPDVRRSP